MEREPSNHRESPRKSALPNIVRIALFSLLSGCNSACVTVNTCPPTVGITEKAKDAKAWYKNPEDRAARDKKITDHIGSHLQELLPPEKMEPNVPVELSFELDGVKFKGMGMIRVDEEGVNLEIGVMGEDGDFKFKATIPLAPPQGQGPVEL